MFTVELDDKQAPLKLPYDISEDPWFAAQKFIDKHNLEQLFLDQVANFIIKNTKGMELGVASSDYADPFTGKILLHFDSLNNISSYSFWFF